MTAPLGRLVRWVEQEWSDEYSGRQTEGIGILGVNRPTGRSYVSEPCWDFALDP